MILFHGYGANYQIADVLKKSECIDATLISFNFPDYDQHARGRDPLRATFGTIDELLPAFYVLKKYVLDGNLVSVDLYGYSAGGGALVNVIAILNTSRYDTELRQIGINESGKKRLLQAIQNGVTILDVPLKSVEELIAFRGSTPEFEVLARNYLNNHLRPIDSLESLRGLSLDVILHFQEPDEALSNRDDTLYIDKLKRANSRGTTAAVIGHDGGHSAPHYSLWQFYIKKMHVR